MAGWGNEAEAVPDAQMGNSTAIQFFFPFGVFFAFFHSGEYQKTSVFPIFNRFIVQIFDLAVYFL